MRKEIIGLLLFFLVIFTLLSLMTYSLGDPSILNAAPSGNISNLFGLIGAHLSGLLIGLFGLGAFWLPAICLLTSIHFLGNHSGRAITLTLAGGAILTITTGSLLSLRQHHYTLFGDQFSAGGLIGIFFKNLLVATANPTGASTILIVLWIIGFILSTGFSFRVFFRRCMAVGSALAERITTTVLKFRERRRRKVQKRIKAKQSTGAPKPKIQIKTPEVKPSPKAPMARQEVFDFMKTDSGFNPPSIKFLDDSDEPAIKADDENLRMQSKLLEKKLEDFGVMGKVVAVTPGPVITTFEYEPAPGVKINRIVNLTDDLALALRAMSIRIVAPIPGKAVIGIEIPNENRLTVRFKDIVVSSAFNKSRSPLTLCLGKDIVGNRWWQPSTRCPTCSSPAPQAPARALP
jgi:S-DNA-T family DNA segregation ATPase FtsK/SpoIIIE